jgi:hypothetical protein
MPHHTYAERRGGFDFIGGGFAQNDLEKFSQTAIGSTREADQRIQGSLDQLAAVENRVGEQRAVDEAGALSDRLSANRAAQFERATRSMDLSPRQQKAATRRLGLTRSLNRASAQGQVRRGFNQRSRAASGAGASFADAFFSQNLSTQGELGNVFAEQQAADNASKAAKKASAISTIGSVVGMAAMFMSSEKLKDDHGREKNLLDKLSKVRVNRWNYKGDKKTHVGPFAEEFNKQFGTDTDRPDMINVIDALGVTLGAVKELNEKVEARGTT